MESKWPRRSMQCIFSGQTIAAAGHASYSRQQKPQRNISSSMKCLQDAQPRNKLARSLNEARQLSSGLSGQTRLFLLLFTKFTHVTDQALDLIGVQLGLKRRHLAFAIGDLVRYLGVGELLHFRRT